MLDWEPEYHSPAPCTLRSRLLHPLATELTDTGSTRQAFWQLSSVTKRHYHLYSPADKHDAMCTTTLLIDRNRDADTLAADARCQTCKQCLTYVNVAKLIYFNQLSRLEIWTIVCKTFNYERYSQQGIDLETEIPGSEEVGK